MDGGHETLLNSESVVDDLGEWGEAVGGARSVGDNVHVSGVGLVVDTIDEHWGVILGWGGEDDLLDTGSQVTLNGLLGEENTSGLAKVVNTGLGPLDLGWVSISEDLDLLSVDNEALITDLDGSWESSVDRVELKKIFKVLETLSWSVDGNDAGLVLLSHESRSEHQSTDSTETVDTHLGDHGLVEVVIGGSHDWGSADSWGGAHLGRGSGSLLGGVLHANGLGSVETSWSWALEHGGVLLSGVGESHDVLLIHGDWSGAGGELWLLVTLEDVVQVSGSVVKGLVDGVTDLLHAGLERVIGGAHGNGHVSGSAELGSIEGGWSGSQGLSDDTSGSVGALDGGGLGWSGDDSLGDRGDGEEALIHLV